MPVMLGAPPEHGFDQPLGLLSDCHRRIERFLAVLQKVSDQVKGRALNDEERRAAEAALTYFQTAAPRHTADEEESLFPLLRASNQPRVHDALKTVEALETDHAAANLDHAEVDSLFRRWIEMGSLTDPEKARLAQLLAGLREMYQHHIAVEDRELFPLAGEVLQPEQITRLGQEMAHRRGLSACGSGH